MSHWISGQGRTTGLRSGKAHGEGIQPSANAPPVSKIFDQESVEEETVLIIGAGTFGTSTAWHLAQNYSDASKVTVVDRADSPPKPAAAIDINRVIRTDYANRMYSNLAYEAWHAWFWSLELQSYFHQVGWLMMDDSDSSSLSKAIRDHYNARGWDPTKEVPLDQLESKWDGIMKGTSTEGFHNAYFNPEVGWCDAAGATQSFMQSAIHKGVQRKTADVTDLILSDDRNRILGVKTSDGQELKADKVLVAAGAWTSALLSPLEDALSVANQDRIENQVRAQGVLQIYFPVSDEEVDRFEKQKMPVIIYGQQGEVLPPSRENKLIKYTHNRSIKNTVTTESGAVITVPMGTTYESQCDDVPESLKREAEEAVLSKLLPSFTQDRKADHVRICYDARSPTEDFLICKYPNGGLENLFVATGGSSHSYKFLPNAGRYIVNVMNGKSNGDEKDAAWGWKNEGWDVRDKSADYPKLGAWTPRREMRDLQGKDTARSRL